ncbi:MAG: heparinase II/III family protein [Bryobacteraceae bacterium]
MPQFSRRIFLAGSAAAPLLSAVAAGTHRNLLTSVWPAAKVAEALLPQNRFHPFPMAAERSAWEALPADARSALIESGEKQLKTPWEVLPATLFLEFARSGNRSRYEAVRDRRRKKLQDLVMAECTEGKGRFADEIANGVWLICEESFWGVPAHLGQQHAGVGLPDVAEPIVELFAGETASLLAWTAYLAGPQLTAVSKLLPERIRLEIDRRVLSPCLIRDDFGWMGFTGNRLNNWTPWICSNWLTAALLEEFDEKRRQAAVSKALRCLDNFLDGYADDGGCDEGPGYWDRAGASLFDCLDLLDAACAGGAAAAFRQPLLREIGRYICRAHIYDDWYTNFGDAPARTAINGDLVYRFGKRVDDDRMMKHGAFAAFFRDAAGIPGESLGRQLPGIFNLAALRQAPREQALGRDVWLPGIQVMAARVKEGSAEGLYLAAQGGHNGKSHNHNDVGNFIVFAGGKPAIIDVGVETYTAKTFSAQRYEIWTMQSAFHNCPTIDGVMQSAGRQFRASEVAYHADDNAAEFRADIAGAYPKQAHLERWHRTLRLLRGKNEIELVDEFRLEQPAQAITLTFMTPRAVAQPGAGVLALADTVKVLYDPQTFTPAIEEIRIEDGRLRSAWGERLFRILLRAENPKMHAVWTTRITQ